MASRQHSLIECVLATGPISSLNIGEILVITEIWRLGAKLVAEFSDYIEYPGQNGFSGSHALGVGGHLPLAGAHLD